MRYLNQIVKTQLVEIPVLTTSSTLMQFKFPNQDFLRQKYIISIEAFCVADIPVSSTGNALITVANMQNAFLTLYEQNPEAVDEQNIESSGQGQWDELIPLVTLHRLQTASPTPFVRDLPVFMPRVIQWEKSYVALANGTQLGNASGPVSFLFQVGYIGNAGDRKS